ncbi:hypothetical protein CD30_19405 [Ureibacillus massiliensis 4400831 = CIP 108448 = CCUG 49529]|uniref:Peptidase S8/S53 domain-containing protein n=1 Tax=Ureibacillus massiliensis 4400831 = CIP 108448 = CCUG 49529 TaxID=1211035 RepID=A0A0A3J901_9BACL|nr:S8 family serine peptidase [Ureibacillus massiliensis]KGR83517.1 hypothetical protein CD30_19405 [Ureibacillus massiliensis 4400831 = CIP 108448 = CCUG 49529]
MRRGIIISPLIIYFILFFVLFKHDSDETFNTELNKFINIEQIDYSIFLMKDIKVGIIDIGFINDHPNLNIVPINDVEMKDEHNIHGTVVAGIISSQKSNVNNFSGIIPGITVYTYSLPYENDISVSALTEGLKVMNEYQMDVINISLATGEESIALKNEIKKAVSQGTVIVASAGNYPNNLNYYPAAYKIPGVISVGAIDREFNLLENTTYNNYIDVWTLGEDVLSLSINPESVKYYSGTSVATPIVTSLVAMLKAKCGKISSSPREIENMLLKGATPIIQSWNGFNVNTRIVDFKNTLLNCEGLL